MNMKLRILAMIVAFLMIPMVWADVVVIVNPSNQVNLSPEEIKNIFLGKAKYFPDGKPALPIQLKEGSPGYENFAEHVLQKNDNQLRAYWSRLVFTGRSTPPKEIATEEEVVNLVAHNPNLIGYVSQDVVQKAKVREIKP